MKTYSIIIPHRNNIDGLNRLINSIYEVDEKTEIFEAFIKNLTVIVIDDHSDKVVVDKLLDLRENYNFYLLFNKRKRSAGACRNMGLKKCNSDYVFFSDSDDYFIKNYFNTILSVENDDSDIIFFSPSSVLDEDITNCSDRHIFYQNSVKNYLLKKDIHSENILRYRWLGPWSKRYKKSYLDVNKFFFDETLASNDTMFSTKTGSQANKINAIDESIYCLTRRKGSLIYSVDKDIIKNRVFVGLNYKNYCDSKKFFYYSDCIFCHLMKGLWLKKYSDFLDLIKYSKRIGVFKDKKYFFKWCPRAFIKSIFLLFKNKIFKSFFEIKS